jgi:hypothetical protein
MPKNLKTVSENRHQADLEQWLQDACYDLPLKEVEKMLADAQISVLKALGSVGLATHA